MRIVTRHSFYINWGNWYIDFQLPQLVLVARDSKIASHFHCNADTRIAYNTADYHTYVGANLLGFGIEIGRWDYAMIYDWTEESKHKVTPSPLSDEEKQPLD